MFLLVGWLVGLSGFHAPTGRHIGTVHMSKKLSKPKNKPRGDYFRIRHHLGAVKGAEALRENSNTSQIPPILIKLES